MPKATKKPQPTSHDCTIATQVTRSSVDVTTFPLYESRLYRALRANVPILDAAISKLVRLSGGITVTTGNTAVDDQLAQFLRTVSTGRGQRGMASFLDSYLDNLLVCGRAAGEIVVDPVCGEVCAIVSVDPDSIAPIEGDSPLDFRLAGVDRGGNHYPLPRQDLLLFTTHQPEPDHPYGVSLLRSLPFCCETLLKIFRAVGHNWERLGNPRFAVTYKPSDGDSFAAAERAQSIATEWQKAMTASRLGDTRDFVAVGDLSVKVIGADGQELDAEVPSRLLMEQIIARTGIPPFMLGLSWSTTERMSAQQADILTSELDAIRRTVTPAVEKICETFLRMRGITARLNIEWNAVNLQDEVELARAALYKAQAGALVGETPSATCE